jgi:transcriptional regulator with XRE-family HTH domain
MATKERAADRGRQRGRDSACIVCREIRRARRSLGLSIASVAHEVGISASTLSRIERARPALNFATLVGHNTVRMEAGVDHVEVEFTFTPPWSVEMIADYVREELRAMGMNV